MLPGRDWPGVPTHPPWYMWILRRPGVSLACASAIHCPTSDTAHTCMRDGVGWACVSTQLGLGMRALAQERACMQQGATLA